MTPLLDNTPSDKYHYQMAVHTGMRHMAGTISKVYFLITGENEGTEVRMLEDVSKKVSNFCCIINNITNFYFDENIKNY